MKFKRLIAGRSLLWPLLLAGSFTSQAHAGKTVTC